MKQDKVDELVAEMISDYAVLSAQIKGLCDLLVKKGVVTESEMETFLRRYSTRRRSLVTQDFLKNRLKASGFSESYIRDALQVFKSRRLEEEGGKGGGPSGAGTRKRKKSSKGTSASRST